MKDIIAFLEYVLNTLGNRSTSARDKDVIVNQSYVKIFRDSQVQIEDDLDENRDVITNKNVQAYLKDVDFFFKGVKFDFTTEDISHYINEDGELFFKVSLIRHLQGIDVEGDSVNNTQKRFIEVNLNPESQDLKIVSIYTNELNQKEALARWWNDLSFEWKAIFKRKVELTQTATDTDIKLISQIEALDISGNRYITNIEPLAQLTHLKRLDISNTNIEDLTPIRNLTKLEELIISNTQVKNLEPLKYAHAIQYLELQNTQIEDITTVKRLVKLRTLNLSGTNVSDLSPLSSLPELEIVNISHTPIFNLDDITTVNTLKEVNITNTNVNTLASLGQLTKLETIRADSTPVSSLEPLSQLKNLKVLSINYTTVSSLAALNDQPQLERVYCDVTLITKEAAQNFMAANPGVLVIFESEDLKTWWVGLSVAWQNIFKQFAHIGNGKPTKEELAKVTNIDSINIAGNVYIGDIEPLSKLRKAEKVNISNTAVESLSPLEGMRNIQYLDISGTNITDFQPISTLDNLKTFKANKTKLPNLTGLFGLTRLTKVEADHTLVNETHVQELLKHQDGVLVLFKSEYLLSWWEGLEQEWKNVFSVQTTVSATPSAEQLHRLIALPVVQFSDANIRDLLPLKDFLQLKELRFSGTAVADLSPLAALKSIEILQATRSPLGNINPVAHFRNIKILDISNTSVDDLKAIAGLSQLQELNCSGTQVSRLKYLDDLTELRVLDISNTSVKRLDEVEHLGLKVLKCYNTRISKKRVEAFRRSNPECNVIYY
ncbi:Leucine-rich repeat protein [Fulvivirga imtechensis AK7]|uniref:Leucine-rich repeat protein n=1 Tax=Fulvivirga imtechensis AK7 TaxID=1237149 RepID=L8JJT1_9BACT|nr:Leucine-rich repeat protein [Fulvivirga imtechensis AK7]